MFSHELPVKEGFPIASSVSKPELTPVPLTVNSIPKQQSNVNGSPHQYAKSYSIGTSSSKIPEQNVAKTIPQPAEQVPKGISFLFHANSPQSNTCNPKQAGLSPKVDNGVKIGHQMIQNSNEITKRTPKGINFLSLGKAPINDPATRKSFNFPFIKDQGIGKSPLSDSSKGEKAGSSVQERENAANKLQTPNMTSSLLYNQSLDQFPAGQSKSTPIFSQGLAQKPLLLNTPSTVQKALRSTLAFAAKFDSEVKMDRSNKTSAPSILDFIYGDRSKTKQ